MIGVWIALGTVAVFAALELGIRLYCRRKRTAPYTIEHPWHLPDEDLCHAFKPHFVGRISDRHCSARINNHGLRGKDFSVPKPDGVYRVLCLGDLRTYGLYVEDAGSYPAQLERLLEGRVEAKRVEVLNAGILYYSSHQGLCFLEKKGLAFEPDLVTIAFGYNDRRFVPSPAENDNPAWFRRQAREFRWRRRFRRSYAITSAITLARNLLGKQSVRNDFERLESRRAPDFNCRVDTAVYRENLRAIAKRCTEHGVPCIFLNLVEVPTVTEAFRLCEQLRAKGRYDEALAALAPARELHGGAGEAWFEALAEYEAGTTLESAGRESEAARAFEHSARAAALWKVMSGGIFVRHAGEYLQIAREVAAEIGAPCVDVEQAFAGRPDLFADYFQLTAEGHRLIAETLLRIILDLSLN